jgi:hydrogenase expression/formation protein HypD
MSLDLVMAGLKSHTGRVKIMEVCGTHTSAIFRNDIRSLISDDIVLVSGPGCPACVTPPGDIDALCELARGGCVLTFGDMFNVPGAGLSLARAKADGADVRLIYSPLEVLALAKAHPDMPFVVAAVGFETTAPAYAALLDALIRDGVGNVRLYTALKTVPQALALICDTEEIDAFICPGHVSAVIGCEPYLPLAQKYNKPFVIAGFEAEHILAALYEILRQIENGRGAVKNLYPAVVREGGQPKAVALVETFFEPSDAFWRGIGRIPDSGLVLRREYAQFSANEFSPAVAAPAQEDLPHGCRCADVMLGRILPADCPLFGASCTPRNPVGPCMASPEGACGIYGGAL